jgi:hypothetical protein
VTILENVVHGRYAINCAKSVFPEFMVSFLAKAGSLRKIQIDTNYFYSGGPAAHGIQTFQPPVNRTLVKKPIKKLFTWWKWR